MSFRNREVFRKGMKEHSSPDFVPDQEKEVEKKIIVEKQVFLHNKLYLTIIIFLFSLVIYAIWYIANLKKVHRTEIGELKKDQEISRLALNDFKENIKKQETRKINYLYNNWVYEDDGTKWFFEFQRNGNILKNFHIEGNIISSNQQFDIEDYPNIKNTYYESGNKHSRDYEVLHISKELLILGTDFRGTFHFERVK